MLPTLLATALPGRSSSCRSTLARSQAMLRSEVAPAGFPTNGGETEDECGKQVAEHRDISGVASVPEARIAGAKPPCCRVLHALGASISELLDQMQHILPKYSHLGGPCALPATQLPGLPTLPLKAGSIWSCPVRPGQASQAAGPAVGPVGVQGPEPHRPMLPVAAGPQPEAVGPVRPGEGDSAQATLRPLRDGEA